MAWLGEGLSSLSSLKGQITNFTKEVLSDGIVDEIADDRTKDLEEAHAKCSQLEELLNSKEAEISILRKQNSELQKAVVEFHSKPKDTRSNGAQDEDAFFWDPPPARSREAKAQSQTKLLQDQLDQATVKIRDLELELNRVQTLNSSNVKDDANFKDEGPSQKTELLRAKQDVMNRIIQMGEKSREVERNTKRLQQDELTLLSDFRTAISKLASPEQFDLIRSALMALENENDQFQSKAEKEKSDSEGYDAEGKSRHDKSPGKEDQLRRKIQELEAENQSLSASMEELDRQNAESLERLLTLKDDLHKKHQSLQNAYEHLYAEHNEALSKIEKFREERQQQIETFKPAAKESLDSAVQTFVHPKIDKETETYTAKEDKEIDVSIVKEDKHTEIDFKDNQQADLETEINKVKDILKNVQLEPSPDHPDDSLLLNLARQFVELKWKKETLERKLTEQSRELKETQDMRDSLQIDCEDMQSNIESLLLQIQHLKQNLPSIPEASEERVASLETETESLQEEIITLRKSNSEMSSELKAIKTAIKEEGANIDLARIEKLLENKSKSKQDKDPAEILETTLDENTALRRRIDVLESELRVSLERCKGLDENIELIEELKLDLENARRELKIALSNNKRLENSLGILQDAKNEVDADNEVLAREKEQLEGDLKLLRESDLKKDEGKALAELREDLKKTSEEKNDLEYDIRNMRKELDNSLEEQDMIKIQNDELREENQQLTKENAKLMDQFSEMQKESSEKIELLNTEMTLMHQELEICKNDLEQAMKNVNLNNETMLKLENDKKQLLEDLSQLQCNVSEDQRLQKDRDEKLLILDTKNKKLNEELRKLKNVEEEKIMLKKEIEEILLEKNLNDNRQELDATLKRLKELEEKVLILENENAKLLNELTEVNNVVSENKKLIEEIEVKRKHILRNEEEIRDITLKLQSTENSVSTLKNENEHLKNKLEQLEHLLTENDNKKMQLVEHHQQELKRKLEEVENNTGKQAVLYDSVLTLKYQNDLDKLKTLKEENQKLKLELDKILTEKPEVEFNLNKKTSQVSEMHLSDDERSIFITQLEEKSKEIEILKLTIAKDKESALMARETVENLSQLISSKDSEIIKINSSFDTLKKERDELVKLIQDKHNESLQYHSEIQRLTQLLNEQIANLQKSNTEKEANLAILQEKESQLLWTQNELQVVRQRLQNIEETSNHSERCGIAEHTLLSNQVSTLEEKNKAMEAAILQDQSNIRYLQEQLTETQTKEAVALKELERLRNHLVEMEANYNEEALQSEEIQKTLEARLMQAEEKLKNTSTMYTSVSVRANQQVETLQQQLALIIQQRDDLQNKISTAEDRVLSYSASLTNLQLVLEQFQRDKEKDIQAATEKLRVQLQDSYKKQEDLVKEINKLKEQLVEAKECIQAASRLTEQLEKKSERIEQLNQEVSRLTELVNTADQRIQEAHKSSEGKVDRSLIKNLLLGYISSPQNDKASVLRVFANVLDFNEIEREKSGLNSSSAKNTWFSSMVSGSPASSKEQEASLSSAFIKFLENESQPKPQLPALPISNSPLSRPGHSRQHSSSSTQSALLLSNVNLPTFPDFVPARNTGSILKEVLKDS